ncbi:MAG: FliG C-terminal domain-containing protein [Bdellovibrionota bacterium]|nr:FliG C-terminal domain-containing protein [Bdellovibrionota bacterium]
MADFKGGVKEAAKMLMGLSGSARSKLLEEIRKKDPSMAKQIESSLISMDDLKYLTPGMLVALLREVNLEKFGLALRTVDQNIVEKILGQVSTGIRLDIEDGLKGKPRAVSEVEAAQNEILDILKKKVEQGHIVIDPEEKLV